MVSAVAAMGQLDAQGREILLGPAQPRLTPKVLFVLSLINLVDCINQVLLLPFVVHMVRDLLDTTSDDPDVAFWASSLVGATSLCELLLAPVCARTALCGVRLDPRGRVASCFQWPKACVRVCF